MSKILEIEGTIKQILDIESGTSKAGKDWVKQNFVIDTAAQFNPDVCFNLFGQDKIDAFKYKVGDFVSVKFNISSREFNGKYYHNIDVWGVKELPLQATQSDIPASTEEDDLPF